MTKGSYVLLIEISVPLMVNLRGKNHDLGVGRYVYCGSANGPGGLEARVARHRRKDKVVHWHIDQVTSVTGVADVGVCTRRSECELVRDVADLGGTGFPAPGMGASDCRTCTAHFLQVSESFSLNDLSLGRLRGD